MQQPPPYRIRRLSNGQWVLQRWTMRLFNDRSAGYAPVGFFAHWADAVADVQDRVR